MTTTDSNVWGGASGHTYTLTRRPDGTTEIDAVVVREGKNLKGRLLGLLLGVAGKRVLGGELAKTAKAVEARYAGRPLDRRDLAGDAGPTTDSLAEGPHR